MESFREFFAQRNALPLDQFYLGFETQEMTLIRFMGTMADYVDALAKEVTHKPAGLD